MNETATTGPPNGIDPAGVIEALGRASAGRMVILRLEHDKPWQWRSPRALPHPAAVAAMQADPTRLAEILSRIDDGIAASERATPGPPGLQAATAIANGGRDTDAEINQF